MTLSVLSLFSGAGGLDFGFEAAGFETACAVEYDKWACKTLRANRSWEVIEADIHDVPSEKMGTADVLIGGPPCQPFSKSAYWALGDTKRLNDPRADTLSAFLRVLRDTKPRAFLLENVVGLTFKGKDEGFRLLESTVKKINGEIGTNYSFEWKVLNSADFGVPQSRERVFIVGARDGRKFRFPEATHQNPKANSNDLFENGYCQWTTAWDAIGELENETDGTSEIIGGKWGDLLPTIPEGENYLWHTDRGGGLPIFGWRRRYWTFLLKLAKNRPSWTIQSQPGSATGPFHWKNRRLTSRELCRLQSFPDGCVIEGSKTEVQRQMGNAVPSLLAEVLASEIRSQLLDTPLNRKTPKLSITKLESPLSPEPVLKVPEKYFEFVGEHLPHPGTGKGRLVAGMSG